MSLLLFIPHLEFSLAFSNLKLLQPPMEECPATHLSLSNIERLQIPLLLLAAHIAPLYRHFVVPFFSLPPFDPLCVNKLGTDGGRTSEEGMEIMAHIVLACLRIRTHDDVH